MDIRGCDASYPDFMETLGVKLRRKRLRLGLTLEETREILSLGRAGRRPCERVAAICDAHLAEIDRKMAELQAFRQHLQEAKRLTERDCGFTHEGFCRAIFSEDLASQRPLV